MLSNTVVGIGCVLFSLVIVYYMFPGLIFVLSLKIGRLKGGLAKKSIVIKDHTITYLIGGTGEPLLLLHGFGADKDNWTLIAPHLKQKFQLIIPDLPGFGESSFLTEKQYSAKDQVELLTVFLQELGVSKLHVGGNSMGGYLAALLAFRLGSDVKSVWLLAPAGVTTDKNEEGVALIESGDNPLIIDSEKEFERLIKLCFEVPPLTPQPIRSFLYKKAKSRAGTNRRLFSDLIGDELPLEGNPLELEKFIGELKARVLLVWGDKDRILHSDGLEVLSQKLDECERDFQSVLMPGMGHIPMVERPKETAQDFLRFSS